MRELLLIGAGGFLGAIARYGLSGWLARLSGGNWPWGTLAVNVIGCLALGALMAYGQRQGLEAHLRLFLTVGILGAFTTFSTFGYETMVLLRAGSYWQAMSNVTLNLMLGMSAVWIGQWLFRC